MDTTEIIRIVAGVLFVIVLVILIQRRRSRVKSCGCMYDSAGFPALSVSLTGSEALRGD